MSRSRISDIYPHNVCHTFFFLFRGMVMADELYDEINHILDAL